MTLAKQVLTVSLLREQVRLSMPKMLGNEAGLAVGQLEKLGGVQGRLGLEGGKFEKFGVEGNFGNFEGEKKCEYGENLVGSGFDCVEYKSRRGVRVAKRAKKFFNKKQRSFIFSRKRVKGKIVNKLKKLEFRIIKKRKYYTGLSEIKEEISF